MKINIKKKKGRKIQVNIKGKNILVGNIIPLPGKGFTFSYLGDLSVDGIEYKKVFLKSTVKLKPLPTEGKLYLSRFKQNLTEEIPVFFVGKEDDFFEQETIDFDDLERYFGLKESDLL